MTIAHTQPKTLRASIEGIGAIGPGFADWPELRALLAGGADYQSTKTLLPAPTMLPPAERRRAVAVVKLTLAVGLEAATHSGLDVKNLPSIFSSSGGDGQNIHAICEVLASSEREISPTRFHNSVHNAASGYWGIATGAMAASTALCAHDGSFAAGLLEAVARVVTENEPALLIAYDVDYPQPLFACRPVLDACALALVLAPWRDDLPLQLTLTLGAAAATAMTNPALEMLRQKIPAARGLPLLERIARAQSGSVVLEYLSDLPLTVEVRA